VAPVTSKGLLKKQLASPPQFAIDPVASMGRHIMNGVHRNFHDLYWWSFFLIRNSLYRWKKKQLSLLGWSQDMEFESFHAAKSCSLPQNGTRTITSLKKHNKWDKASGTGI